jgi:hypothetical protein
MSTSGSHEGCPYQQGVSVMYEKNLPYKWGREGWGLFTCNIAGELTVFYYASTAGCITGSTALARLISFIPNKKRMTFTRRTRNS